jgi:hypothetical protein
LNGRAFATAYHIKSIESRVLRQGTITSEMASANNAIGRADEVIE